MTTRYGIYLIANFMQALYPNHTHRNLMKSQPLQQTLPSILRDSFQRFSAKPETRTHTKNRN
jgi:hypothetical protein